MKTYSLWIGNEHSFFGALLPNPTFLCSRPDHLDLRRDPTGKSHFPRYDLYLEAIITNHHNQKHVSSWPWLLIREGPNWATEFFYFIWKELEAGCQYPCSAWSTGPEPCLSHNGTGYTTVRTTQGQMVQRSVSSKGSGDSVLIQHSCSPKLVFRAYL